MHEKIYKTNNKNEFIYPKNSNGIEEYVKDQNNKEIYIAHKGIEIYAFNYPRKCQLYAMNGEEPYYAKFNQKEIYAFDYLTHCEYFITINNQDQYCKDNNNIQYYPKDFLGRDQVAQNMNNYFYAIGENQNSYYSRDEYGNEIVIRDKNGLLLLITKDDEPVAPLKRDGTVNYIKINDKEILYEYNKEPFVGRDIFHNYQYPTNSIGDEYYANDNLDPICISDRNSHLKYALSKAKEIIYPKNPNGEYYLSDNDGSYNTLKRHSVNFKRYVLRDNRYHYPVIQTGNKNVEMIINDIYAINENQKQCYPKDSLKNEYINSKGLILDSYPVTNDGNIIIPNYENKPLVKASDTHLINKIQCLLYRPDFNTYDFLINCSSKNYPIFHLSNLNSFSLNLNYIIAGLCSIIILLCFVLIVKH